MGVFSFVSNAGKKLFGGGQIDESAVLEHLRGLGLKVRSLSVVAFQEEKKLAVTGQVESQEDREKLILAAGNIDGVEQVDDRIRVVEPSAQDASASETPAAPEAEAPSLPEATEADDAPPTTESTFYTVQSGDTLSGIAKAHYGKAGLYMKIFEANTPMLSDPNRIYPGQVLRIPRQD